MVTRPTIPTARQSAEVLREWPHINLLLEAHEAFALVGQLQLALRHPANRGPSADVAVRVIHALKAALPVELHPLIHRGFDASYDLPES